MIDETTRQIIILRNQGVRLRDIASRLKMSQASIYRKMEEVGVTFAKANAWPQWQIDALKDGLKGGLTYRAIGRHIGRTQGAVRAKKRELFGVDSARLCKHVLPPDGDPTGQHAKYVCAILLERPSGFPVADAERGRIELARRATRSLAA